MNIPSNYLNFRNTKREEIYKILINIDPNEGYGTDEIPGRILNVFLRMLFFQNIWVISTPCEFLQN